MVAELQDVLTRIQMEYVEMPDLKLTLWQARRLWDLEPAVCQAAMQMLVASRFLSQTPDGAYVRRGTTTARRLHL